MLNKEIHFHTRSIRTVIIDVGNTRCKQLLKNILFSERSFILREYVISKQHILAAVSAIAPISPQSHRYNLNADKSS